MANTTKIADMINPEVMGDMISAKIKDAIVVTPFAKIDDTLVGQPGSKITVPRYKYIGDAADVAEGADIGEAKLETEAVEYEVKKAAKGVNITDEAMRQHKIFFLSITKSNFDLSNHLILLLKLGYSI